MVEVIVNAGAGAGRQSDLQQRIADAFRAKGAEARISLAGDGTELFALAARAVRGDADCVVAAGGDGTISAVASAIVGAGKTLGVLPSGTMNHFAKDLKIPLDFDSAIETIAAGHVIRVDVGEVNGRIFVNNSGLGLYPRIIRERARQQRLGWGKWPAYAWAALALLRRYPFLEVRLSAGGTDRALRTPFVFVGNNEYHMEQLDVGSRACLDKGELSVYTARGTGRLGLVRLALRALLGGLRQERDVLAFTTAELRVGARRRQLRVSLDGEVVVMQSPLHYRVRPGALRVITPAAECAR